VVGAGLGLSGAAMQGLFRNPLADPGLIGVSSGAGFAAAGAIVLGGSLLSGALGAVVLPLAAFLGSLATTLLVWRIAQHGGSVQLATMLLAGSAFNAVTGAGTGALTLIACEPQLRSITFWSLGSLNGASWSTLATV